MPSAASPVTAIPLCRRQTARRAPAARGAEPRWAGHPGIAPGPPPSPGPSHTGRPAPSSRPSARWSPAPTGWSDPVSGERSAHPARSAPAARSGPCHQTVDAASATRTASPPASRHRCGGPPARACPAPAPGWRTAVCPKFPLCASARGPDSPGPGRSRRSTVGRARPAADWPA